MVPRKKTQDETKIAAKIRKAARYQEMKGDPVQAALMKQKEQEKYKRKKERGQRKLVSQMTSRERRAARKNWRAYTKSYRQKKIQEAEKATTTLDGLDEDEGSDEDQRSSPYEDSGLRNQTQSTGPTPSRQALVGKKRAKKNRENSAAKIKDLQTKVDNLQVKVKSQGKTITRLRDVIQRDIGDKNSPGKIVRAVMEESNPTVVKRRLLLGEVLQREISENVKTLKNKAKRDLTKVLVGDGAQIQKYKLVGELSSIVARRAIESVISSGSDRPNTMKTIHNHLKADIARFLEEDENSRCLPGKKDCISRGGLKKQKRLLLEDMKDLHKKFEAGCEYNVSYSTFCKYRPFWVLTPDVTKRETCVCQTHANFELRLEALRRSNVISSCKVSRFKQQVCCDPPTIECYHRKCFSCRDNTIIYGEDGEFDGSQVVALHQWASTNVQYLDPKTKTTKQTKRTVKVMTEKPLIELIQETDGLVDRFLEHEGNVYHQHSSMKYLKESLECDEILIHCDFSENYATKYSSEIQAIHFGGNRQSVSLHTVVVYMKKGNEVTPFSLCTVSQNLDHSPGAIWAHMQPIFGFVNCTLTEVITKVHFLSDGPSTQYRNKTLFYLLQHRLRKSFPHLTMATWNYSEAGHGKGAPDGVGGTIKRTADKIVAQGHDITDVDTLILALSNKLHNVLLFKVESTSIQEMTESLPRDISSFKGTMKVHQVIWRKGEKELRMNQLSCFVCPSRCKHHAIGQHVSRPNEIENEQEDSFGIQPKTASCPFELQGVIPLSDIIISPDQLINSTIALGENIIADDDPVVYGSMSIEECFDKIVNDELHTPEPSCVQSGLCFHCGGTITAVKKGLKCEVCTTRCFHEACKVVMPSTTTPELQWFDCCKFCIDLLN